MGQKQIQQAENSAT